MSADGYTMAHADIASSTAAACMFSLARKSYLDYYEWRSVICKQRVWPTEAEMQRGTEAVRQRISGALWRKVTKLSLCEVITSSE